MHYHTRKIQILLLISMLCWQISSYGSETSGLIINGVPYECINAAAEKYYVPIPLIISTLLTENGRVGDAIANKNGTHDYGPMQINTIWLNKLERYGYTRHAIQYNACTNVEVGAWILSQAISRGEDLWRGVGNYHSHTLRENAKYAYKVRAKHDALMQSLQ